jgi:protein TorT
MKKILSFCGVLGTASLLSVTIGATSLRAQPWTVNTWDPPFNYKNPPKSVEYTPIEKASKKWHLCVAFPHLKDPYWMATDYGVVDQAKKTGVAITLVEAGGYPNLDKQIEQIKDCVAAGADATLVGTVSFDKLTPTVVGLSEKVPVLGTVNNIEDDGIAAKSGVDWTDMGAAAGVYLAKMHPKGSKSARIAWLPGPETAGWVKFTSEGFHKAIADSAVTIVTTKYGDTGEEIQLKLVEDVLEEFPDIDYIVGNALAIEAAMGVVAKRKLEDKVKLVADYFTPGIYRGIKRGKIFGAPTDSAVLQGRLSVDQAVRILEKKDYLRHIGPKIFVVDQTNVSTFAVDDSLAPPTFQATFKVE